MIKYNYQDYLFISSRIRAMENSLISRETLKNMSEARSEDELYTVLEDSGIQSVTGEYGEKSFEPFLRELLSVAYKDVLKSVPEPQLFTFFTYPYDCHNLKAAIKCSEKGEGADDVLLPYGSISVEDVKEAVRTRSFDVFPENMAEAASKAIESFAKSRNPQDIDLLLDSALFSDMKESAKENPIDFFSRILTVKADTVNVLSAIRIIKTGGGYPLFERAFADGGSLSITFFATAFDSGLASFSEVLSSSEEYSSLSNAFSGDSVNVTEAEKISEKLLASQINKARNVQAGAEVVAGYIAAVETQVKNIRILITGKKLKAKAEDLFERLCKDYV